MHDSRTLLENRLERFVRDYLRPAVYRAAAPVTLTGWDAPGEPVPFADRGGPTPLRTRRDRVAVGARPWGTTWLHITGEVPDGWRPGGRSADGTSVELVVDLGFAGGPRFQAEGSPRPTRAATPV